MAIHAPSRTGVRFAVAVLSAVCASHAVVHADTQDRGTPVGSHDLLIAATAMHHGMPVLTCNGKDFRNVPGLVVFDYDLPLASDPPQS